ncbi:hypothetical protein HanPSC8_Chr09g0378481 [Helianthus annuus]|nr:hypothetical protein HanPSC8_Chr09g0378481 [Helianthus annuus]
MERSSSGQRGMDVPAGVSRGLRRKDWWPARKYLSLFTILSSLSYSRFFPVSHSLP